MSGPGRLSRASFFIDGKQAYVLTQGQLWIYVTALPGLNLEPYVNRTVNLYGLIAYLNGSDVFLRIQSSQSEHPLRPYMLAPADG